MGSLTNIIGLVLLMALPVACSRDSTPRPAQKSQNQETPPPTGAGTQPLPPATGIPGTGWPASPASPAAPGLLPCDVQTIVDTHCSRCHGPVPKFGGGFSLTTIDDWTAPARSDPGDPVWHMARQRINHGAADQDPLTAARSPMPPAPNPRLNPAELERMNAWIDGGLPARLTACTTPAAPGTIPAPAPAPPPGTPAPAPAPAPAPTPAPAPAPGSSAATCDGETYTFVAHADGQRDTPYKVGVAKDAYFNFTFRSPWKGTVYAKSIIPVIDNDRVLHHWLLYGNDNAAGGDLRVKPSSGAHLGGELLNGWAPGGQAHIYKEGTGRPLPEGFYNLEIHYNSDDPNAVDRSGVTLCVTKEKPKNLVELTWLGTDLILNSKEATGTCRPKNQTGPIHITSVTPHMHTHGRHIRAIINRADGTKEPLHDQAFNFESQVTWPKNITIYPGDTITTTCLYDTNVRFGKGTGDEMCYLYTTHWPAGALRDGGLLGSIHGPNTCLGGLGG